MLHGGDFPGFRAVNARKPIVIDALYNRFGLSEKGGNYMRLKDALIIIIIVIVVVGGGHVGGGDPGGPVRNEM